MQLTEQTLPVNYHLKVRQKLAFIIRSIVPAFLLFNQL